MRLKRFVCPNLSYSVSKSDYNSWQFIEYEEGRDNNDGPRIYNKIEEICLSKAFLFW